MLVNSFGFIAVVSCVVVSALFLLGIKIVQPTCRGLVERLGKYHHVATPGFNWILPGVDRMVVAYVTDDVARRQHRDTARNDELNSQR